MDERITDELLEFAKKAAEQTGDMIPIVQLLIDHVRADSQTISELREENERLREEIKLNSCRCMCWSGMDDAPDDGTEIIVHYELPDLKPDWPRVVIVFWSKSQNCWVHQGRASYGYSDCYQPDAWMPKPIYPALHPPKEGE